MDESAYDVGRLGAGGCCEILEHLSTVDSARRCELIRKIGMHATTIGRSLKYLKKEGLVEEKDGYQITPNGRKALPLIQKLKRYLQ